MKKRALAIFLAVIMTAALLSATASAAEVTESTSWIATEIVPMGKYDPIEQDGEIDGNFGFSNGLARVKLDGKWGYIDKTGAEVIPCKYDYATDFLDGFAFVNLDGKARRIDKIGTEIKLYDYMIVNFSIEEDLTPVWMDGKWGYIDKTGEEVIPCELDYQWVGTFSEGLAEVGTKEHFLMGYIDKTGVEVIPCKYYSAESFHDGLARVGLEDERGYVKWGFIDKNGKEIGLGHGYINDFSDGLLVIESDGKYGYIDKTGAEVIPCELDYGEVQSFYEGLAAVKIGERWGAGEWGYIDKTGAEVIPCKYDHATDFSEGLAGVHLNDKWGFIDKTGTEIISCKYDYDYVSSFSEGLAEVCLNDKWGSIDKTGAEVIPCKYDWVDGFRDGFVEVAMESGEFDEYDDVIYTWGLVDRTGMEVIPCKYDSIGVFNDRLGLCAVWSDGKLGFVDAAGNEAIPCTFACEYGGFVDDGLVCMRRNADRYARGGLSDYEYGLLSLSAVKTYSGSMEGEGKGLDWSCSETGRVAVSGELADEETVLVGRYDDQGRLTELKWLTRDEMTVQMKAGADKIKLFWLNAASQPQSPSVTVWGK